jgi:hypothetical protein
MYNADIRKEACLIFLYDSHKKVYKQKKKM